MPGFLKALIVAAAAGVASGSLMYAVFTVGGTVSPALNGVTGFALGFGSAAAIALAETVKEDKK